MISYALLILCFQLPDYLTDAGEMAAYVHRVGELWEWLNAESPSSKPRSFVTVDSDASHVVVEGVSVVTPDGRALLQNVSFSVDTTTAYQSLFIQGPSGCGKSTLFRMLAGLIPVPAGHMRRPPTLTEALIQQPTAPRNGLGHNRFVMFVPQRSYLPRGSLRQLLLYPLACCVHADAAADEALLALLAQFKLSHLNTMSESRFHYFDL